MYGNVSDVEGLIISGKQIKKEWKDEAKRNTTCQL